MLLPALRLSQFPLTARLPYYLCNGIQQTVMGQIAASLPRNFEGEDVLSYRDTDDAKSAFVKHLGRMAELEPGGVGFCSRAMAAITAGGGGVFDLYWSKRTEAAQSSGAAVGYQAFHKACAEEMSRLGNSAARLYIELGMSSLAVSKGMLGPGKKLLNQTNITEFRTEQLHRLGEEKKVRCIGSRATPPPVVKAVFFFPPPLAWLRCLVHLQLHLPSPPPPSLPLTPSPFSPLSPPLPPPNPLSLLPSSLSPQTVDKWEPH